MPPTPGIVDLHCSAVTRELGEPAPGSAGTMTHVVLIELPLPWPKEIEDHPLLAGVDLDTMKIFGIATSRPAADTHTIISYQAAGSDSTSFLRAERSVSTAELAASVSATAKWAHEAPAAGDLLICTHGSRDRCCGQYGTLLHIEVLAQAPEATTVWRASHLGGHRFAPTILSFPDGLSWAYVTGDDVAGILARSADPARVADSLRGAVALGSPAEQAADAAMFKAEGWSWLTGARQFTTTEHDGTITVEATSANASATVTVEQLDPVPVPPCGEPLDQAKKMARPVRARLSLSR